MSTPLWKPDDSSWVKTHTHQYLYVTLKLNDAAIVAKKEPGPHDYAALMAYLIPACRDQLLVFNRLCLEVKAQTFPWNRPPFVEDSPLPDLADGALRVARVWQRLGARPDFVDSVFAPLSQAFLGLLDANSIMRKTLGWSDKGPTDGAPPQDPPQPLGV